MRSEGESLTLKATIQWTKLTIRAYLFLLLVVLPQGLIFFPDRFLSPQMASHASIAKGHQSEWNDVGNEEEDNVIAT